MERRGKPRDFEADIFNFDTKEYITNISSSTDIVGEPYSRGDFLGISDSVLFKNNSRRARKCEIMGVEKVNSSKYNLFIKPTNEDIPSMKINLENLAEFSNKDNLKKFRLEIFNAENNEYLVTSNISVRNLRGKQPYKIGDMLPVPDCFINNNNNCRKLRKCIIKAIMPDKKEENTYILHVKPTGEEYFLGRDTQL
jgi:hypothetical protein